MEISDLCNLRRLHMTNVTTIISVRLSKESDSLFCYWLHLFSTGSHFFKIICLGKVYTKTIALFLHIVVSTSHVVMYVTYLEMIYAPVVPSQADFVSDFKKLGLVWPLVNRNNMPNLTHQGFLRPLMKEEMTRQKGWYTASLSMLRLLMTGTIGKTKGSDIQPEYQSWELW